MLAFGSFHSLAGLLDQRAVVDLVGARHARMKPKFTLNTHNFPWTISMLRPSLSLKNEIHRKKAANVRASRNKKESMPTRIKQPEQSWERTKSIISWKFEWELPLIAEFKIHTESRFNRKFTPHFIGFLELTLKHKQAVLSSDKKKSSEQSQQLSRKSWEWKK